MRMKFLGMNIRTGFCCSPFFPRRAYGITVANGTLFINWGTRSLTINGL